MCLREEAFEMSRCSTLPHKFCQATMTAISWLKHNCCKILLVLILGITLPAVTAGMLCAALMCSTYECYSYTKGIPVMICTIGMPLILTVFGIFLALYYIFMAITGQEQQLWNKISTVIEPVFSSFLKKANSDEEEAKFIVLGYEVSLKEMHWLTLTIVQASLLAFALFWDDFLFEVSSSCSTDSNIHCFYSTTDSPLHYQIALNCSNKSRVKNIICYKYVFNTGRAAASAIGIISATGFIMYTVCIVFLKVLDGARWSKWSIRLVKSVAIVEVMIFCTVLGALQVSRTGHVVDILGIINTFTKTLAMGSMVSTSVFFFPIAKFTKSAYRDGYEPITNEPQHETV